MSRTELPMRKSAPLTFPSVTTDAMNILALSDLI